MPTFLKFAFIAIAGGALAYFFIYMYGEVNHPDRGVLVTGAQRRDRKSSAALMYYRRRADRGVWRDRGGVLVPEIQVTEGATGRDDSGARANPAAHDCPQWCD